MYTYKHDQELQSNDHSFISSCHLLDHPLESEHGGGKVKGEHVEKEAFVPHVGSLGGDGVCGHADTIYIAHQVIVVTDR